jgi:hypothetical protein
MTYFRAPNLLPAAPNAGLQGGSKTRLYSMNAGIVVNISVHFSVSSHDIP